MKMRMRFEGDPVKVAELIKTGKYRPGVLFWTRVEGGLLVEVPTPAQRTVEQGNVK